MNPQLIQNAVKDVVTATVAAAATAAKKYGPKFIEIIGEVMKKKKG